MIQIHKQGKRIRISVSMFFLSFLFFACASKPAVLVNPNSENIPHSRIQLTNIRAKNPDELELIFVITTENTDTAPYQLKQLEAVLNLGDVPFESQVLKPSLQLASNSTSMQEISFQMDLRVLPNLFSDDLQYDLELHADFLNTEGSLRTRTTSLKGFFPRVHKPLFRISSIKIHRDELINTSMKVSLEIENINSFPLELSALRYEIFGEGHYWAEGIQKNSFQIPAHDKAVVISDISMNFMNMKRSLLDQFITMQDVGYRFTGDVKVLTGIEYLSEFIMEFDEAGRTAVVE